jgi:mannose-6-phosphate isomerase-like protein (cupin superfamily)
MGGAASIRRSNAVRYRPSPAQGSSSTDKRAGYTGPALPRRARDPRPTHRRECPHRGPRSPTARREGKVDSAAPPRPTGAPTQSAPVRRTRERRRRGVSTRGGLAPPQIAYRVRLVVVRRRRIEPPSQGTCSSGKRESERRDHLAGSGEPSGHPRSLRAREPCSPIAPDVVSPPRRAEERTRAIVMGPGDGQTVANPAGGGLTYKARSGQTGEALTAWESTAAPGEGPPLHLHVNEDEFMYVLDGRLRFRLDETDHTAPAAHSCSSRGVSPTPGRTPELVRPGFCSFSRRGRPAWSASSSAPRTSPRTRGWQMPSRRSRATRT